MSPCHVSPSSSCADLLRHASPSAVRRSASAARRASRRENVAGLDDERRPILCLERRAENRQWTIRAKGGSWAVRSEGARSRREAAATAPHAGTDQREALCDTNDRRTTTT